MRNGEIRKRFRLLKREHFEETHVLFFVVKKTSTVKITKKKIKKAHIASEKFFFVVRKLQKCINCTKTLFKFVEM